MIGIGTLVFNRVFWFQGLIPRAKLLLTIGGTFFLGFWPLIVITVSFFFALYFVRFLSYCYDFSLTLKLDFVLDFKMKTNRVAIGIYLLMQFFGPSFVHNGETPISPPPYVDPYALLEDERISQTAPRVN